MRDPLSTAGHPVAAKLMSWLQQGIASGSIPFNNSGTFVHFVPDGMLLVAQGFQVVPARIRRGRRR
ncbi:hypothetical protein DX980_20880 (plasmid) [Burkholderia gladioli]|nr:hypothetical protein DX980_20880 [Burkholderia gladioli]